VSLVNFTVPQFVLAALQLVLLLGGGYGLIRTFGSAEARARFFRTSPLPHWPISGAEVTLLVLVIFLLGTIGQGAATRLFGPMLEDMPDASGWKLAVFGLGFHGCALLGWPVAARLRGKLYSDYGARPPPPAPAPRLAPWPLLRASVITVALVLPVLTVVTLLWRGAGLPDAPQDLVPIFASVQSPVTVLAMVVIACLVAPANEELLFRGAIFRYLRQTFGRGAALAVSGLVFGAVHANLAGFLPLSILGVALALAYERTGDIRVPILAHALFNLNTILVLVSGLQHT